MTRSLLTDQPVIVFGGTGAVVECALVEVARAIVVANSPASSDRQSGASYTTVDALDEQSVASLYDSLDTAPWAVVNLIGGYTGAQAVADLDLAVLRRQLKLNLRAPRQKGVSVASERRRTSHSRFCHTPDFLDDHTVTVLYEA